MVWPLAIPLIGAAVSALGTASQNRQSDSQARRQMEFQERMSSTSHQREAADLQAAGLNRILTATGGSGASTPSGASAPVQNVLAEAGNVPASALAAKLGNEQLENLRATRGLTLAQIDSTAAGAEFTRSQTSRNAAQLPMFGAIGDAVSGIRRWAEQNLGFKLGETSTSALESARSVTSDAMTSADESFQEIKRRLGAGVSGAQQDVAGGLRTLLEWLSNSAKRLGERAPRQRGQFGPRE